MTRLILILASLAVVVPAFGEIPLETATVAFKDGVRERVWDGRVEAVQQATVSAQTSVNAA